MEVLSMQTMKLVVPNSLIIHVWLLHAKAIVTLSTNRLLQILQSKPAKGICTIVTICHTQNNIRDFTH